MKRQQLEKIAIMIFTGILAASMLAACGKKQEMSPEEKEQAAKEAIEAAEREEQEAFEEVEAAEEILQDFIGEMDLSGSWEDEVSQRAGMDAVRNEDGSYDIRVHWGGSATETAIWEIHGTYDEVSGMLSYSDGKYSIHTWDENDNETVSGEETTEGAFMKEGDKLRWSDSKNVDDGLFVKVE